MDGLGGMGGGGGDLQALVQRLLEENQALQGQVKEERRAREALEKRIDSLQGQSASAAASSNVSRSPPRSFRGGVGGGGGGGVANANPPPSSSSRGGTVLPQHQAPPIVLPLPVSSSMSKKPRFSPVSSPRSKKRRAAEKAKTPGGIIRQLSSSEKRPQHRSRGSAPDPPGGTSAPSSVSSGFFGSLQLSSDKKTRDKYSSDAVRSVGPFKRPLNVAVPHDVATASRHIKSTSSPVTNPGVMAAHVGGGSTSMPPTPAATTSHSTPPSIRVHHRRQLSGPLGGGGGGGGGDGTSPKAKRSPRGVKHTGFAFAGGGAGGGRPSLNAVKRRISGHSSGPESTTSSRRREVRERDSRLMFSSSSGGKGGAGSAASRRPPTRSGGNRLRWFKGAQRRSDVARGPTWKRATTFDSHLDGVLEVSPCPWSSRVIASSSADRMVMFWGTDAPDAVCSQPLAVYCGHRGSVNSIRFHPTKPWACTASGDRLCHILKLGGAFDSPSSSPMDFSRDMPKTAPSSQRTGSAANRAAMLTSLAAGNATRRSSRAEGEKRDSFRSSSSISGGANASLPPTFLTQSSAGGDSGDDDMNDDLFDMGTPVSSIFRNYQLGSAQVIKAPDAELRYHSDPVTSADWIHDGTSVVTGSWDHTCVLWSVDTQRTQKMRVYKDHTDRITNVTTATDAPLFLSSSADTTFQVTDVRTSESVIYASHNATVTSAIFSPVHTQTIASASEDCTVQFWDLRKPASPVLRIARSAPVNRLCFSPGGRVVTMPSDDGSVRNYNLNGEIVGQMDTRSSGSSPDNITQLAARARSTCRMVTSAAWNVDERDDDVDSLGFDTPTSTRPASAAVFTSGWPNSVLKWSRESFLQQQENQQEGVSGE